LHGKETLESRRCKEGQHNHEVNGIGIPQTVFCQCHEGSANGKKKKKYHRDHWFVHSPIIDYALNDLNKTMAVTAIAK
jgi:hypothetical protein